MKNHGPSLSVVAEPFWLMSLAALGLALTAAAVALAGCIMPGQKPALGASNAAMTPCGPEGVIDDGEDNNNQGAVVDGRGGYWYTYADDAGTSIVPEAGSKGGTFTMSPGGANGSRFAANARGRVAQGNVVFGAVGLNLVDPKNPYDASRYGGIAFWARKGPGSAGQVRFKVPDINTDDQGGICKECFNAFGMDLNLTESWQRFVIPFARMTQMPGWGSPRPRRIDKKNLFGLQWQVAQPGASFDLWIDDVEFVGCE